MDEILNPNCSEVIWRLNIPSRKGERSEFESDTATIYFEEDIDLMTRLIDDAVKRGYEVDKLKISVVEYAGGVFGHVQNAFYLGIAVNKGKITHEEAIEILRKTMDYRDDVNSAQFVKLAVRDAAKAKGRTVKVKKYKRKTK